MYFRAHTLQNRFCLFVIYT